MQHFTKNIASGFDHKTANRIAANLNSTMLADDDDWTAIVHTYEGSPWAKVEVVEKDTGEHVYWVDCELGDAARAIA